MTSDAPTPYAQLKARFLAVAALSGPFNPNTVLETLAPTAFVKGLLQTLQMLSEVSGSFLIEKRESGDMWQMRMSRRHEVTRALKDAGDLPEGVASATETAAKQALFGTGGFAKDHLRRLLQSARASTEVPLEQLSTAVELLRRAGPAAPGYELIDGLQALANRQAVDRQNELALAKGFFGREAELARACNWLFDASRTGMVQTLHVSGLPGIGKSYLIERIVQIARHHKARPIVIRLDFDRAALRSTAPRGLFLEISRQVGEALPEQAASLRMTRDETIGQSGMQGSGQSGNVPRELISKLHAVLADSDRPVALFLDTLEALRSEGDTHVNGLFENLDRLVRQKDGLRIRVISAGRAEAIRPARNRVTGDPLYLAGLEREAAYALLAQRALPEHHWPRVFEVTRGNPLGLVLAAKALSENPGILDELPALDGDGNTALAIEGYLYRAILSRVPDRLKGYANEGLLVHRVDPQVLSEVVAPALGESLGIDEAGRLLADLQQHHWLVTEEKIDGKRWTMHRADIRSVVLPLIYAEDRAVAPASEGEKAGPTRTAEIDRRAAEWFSTRAPVTALYHRLQMLRHGAALPEVAPDLARRFDDDMLADLLPRARDAVLQARGQRSGFARMSETMSGAPPEDLWLEADSAGPVIEWHRKRLILRDAPTRPIGVDERLERDLEIMLERGDLREAGAILKQGLTGAVALGTTLADLILVYLWWTGQWTTARRIYDRRQWEDWNAFFGGDFPARKLALIEMRAEWDFARLTEAMADEDLRNGIIGITAYAEGKGLAGGALGFAVAKAMGRAPSEISLPGYVRRGFELITPHMEPSSALSRGSVDDESNRIRSEFGLGLEDATEDLALFAGRLAAPLTPYGGLVFARIRARDDPGAEEGVLEAYIEGLRRSFGKVLALSVPHIRPQSEDPTAQMDIATSEMVALLNAAGLSAHWLGAFAFAHPVADFPLLAEAAERWRRTVNGSWSYDGKPPDGWVERAGPDDEVEALVAGLRGERADETIRVWLAPDEARSTALAARFASRSGRIVEKTFKARAGAFMTPATRAGRLSTLGMPVVHACAMAVIARDIGDAGPRELSDALEHIIR